MDARRSPRTEGPHVLKWLDQQDPTYAATLASRAVFGLVIFLAGVIGWFGVGLVGLAGLVLAHRIELSQGSVAGGFATPDLYRKQLEEQAREDPRKRAADAGARQRMLLIMKTVAVAVAALGVGGIVLHWS